MTEHALYLELHEPHSAHALVVRGWEWAKQRIADGKPVVAEFSLLEEKRDVQRNREYWGYVLRPISEQAQVDGIGSDAEGWHWFYKKMFLGYRFVKIRQPGKKRPIVRRELRSTTDLSDREMREYMEQVRAHAATTFSVQFPAMPRDTAAPARRTAAQMADTETGEILETPA